MRHWLCRWDETNMKAHGAAVRCVHVRIEGRVQGVGFRTWTELEATALGLTGWVRNCRDGAVEAVFHGDEDAVQTMLDVCRFGPPAARVEAVEILGENAGIFQRFEVLPTA
jgi:acylphosphatase